MCADLQASQVFFQLLDLALLPAELRLLLFECIDEDGAQLRVPHTFNLTFIIVRDQQGFNGGDILRAESEIR
jgi:hypothetical protein